MIELKTELSRMITIRTARNQASSVGEFYYINGLVVTPIKNYQASEMGVYVAYCPIVEVDVVNDTYLAGENLYINNSDYTQPLNKTGGAGYTRIAKVLEDGSGTKVKAIFIGTLHI